MGRVEPVSVEDRQTVPLKVQRKTTRRLKKRVVLIIVLLFLFLASSTSAVVGYLTYHTYQTDLSLAQAGMQHLRSAMTLLDSLRVQPYAPHTVERAQQEFADTMSDARAIEAGLANFSGIGRFVPIYGTRLIAAIHLSALAVDISQAGIGGCEILKIVLARLGSPLNASIPELKNADFTTLSNEYQTVKTSLNAGMNEALLLQPGDVSFDARLVKLLQEFQADTPMLRAALAQMDRLLPALPTLLGIGSPTHYLVEILDSTELRPGGGFIGNYGILTIEGGRPLPLHITDVDLLDRPFEFAGHTIPYPATYNWFTHFLAPYSWSLRDSNLDADFPTAARYGELNFEREGGNIPLQGVIAITPFIIEQILSITGPISVPEYHETITAQNLVARIHYHQLGAAAEGPDYIASPDGRSSLRKHFTELLGEHFLARIQQLPSTALPGLVKAFAHAVASKDVQVYLNAGAGESILQQHHLAGAIESSGGDSLFVVDANVAGDKANSFITSTISDQVTIDNMGNAIHHMTLRYAWKPSGNVYGSSLYKDYIRIYAPPESTLSKQDGWQQLGTSTAFGSQVWAGLFTFVYGQTRTITLQWTSHSIAANDVKGWHYQYLLQRQAGIQRTLELQIKLPSCATMTNQWGGLLFRGKKEETLTQSLTQDLNVGVDYACK